MYCMLYVLYVFLCSRHVTHRSSLEGESYMLLPTTFEPGQEATFTFRVLSRGQVGLASTVLLYINNKC